MCWSCPRHQIPFFWNDFHDHTTTKVSLTMKFITKTCARVDPTVPWLKTVFRSHVFLDLNFRTIKTFQLIVSHQQCLSRGHSKFILYQHFWLIEMNTQGSLDTRKFIVPTLQGSLLRQNGASHVDVQDML